MLKINTILLATVLVLAANTSMAAIVTHGFLTTDDTTNFITDTNSGRLYTRFDAFNLSYADTLTAIGSGGAFEGWSIATAEVSDDFIAASLGLPSTPCTGHVAYGTQCGNVSGWSEGDFGLSYQGTVDFYAYLNGLPGNEVSLVGFYSNGNVQDFPNWQQVFHLDDHGGNAYPSNPINLLLYNDQASVPESSTLAIFLLAVMFLGRRLQLSSQD